jgi:anion-transporting  ArsA/GET3 family ATPase
MDLKSLLEKQIIFVSGKGGTGKTTLSLLLAKLAADLGGKTLLCHINRLIPEPIEDNFLSSSKISQIDITPEICFKEFIVTKIKSEILFNIAFNKFHAFDMLKKAAPALKELLLLGKIYFEANQTKLFSGRKWDHIIVDMPSTGHALTMLNITKIIKEIFNYGPIAGDADKIQKIIHDKERTAITLVAIPEFMALEETKQFIDKAENEMEFSLGPIIINKIPPEININSNVSDENLKNLVNFFDEKSKNAFKNISDFKNFCNKEIYEIPDIAGGLNNNNFLKIFNERITEFYE